MQQLVTLRTQQLFEQEKILLSRLQRMFPGDPDIADVLRDHKERNALEVLSRRSPLSRGTTLRDPAPSQETQLQINSMKTSLLEAARQNPELVFDFAMAADMLEAPELALTILQQVPLTHDQQWFLLEVKLKCRRFLEVLSDLNQLELALAHEPETFFATAYLRAQAYWGMQQKHMAIEILENILEARPNYRSSSALLDLWRMQ
jgi:thioredoxin-like negative regulator of GroEL